MIEFYMSVVGVFLTVMVALLAAWMGWRFSRGMTARPAYRIGITSLATLAVVAAMTWDVVRTSITMAQLCMQAGIFIKKSVRVDGYLTNIGGADELKAGFNFIEKKGAGSSVITYRIDQDGIKEQVHDKKNYKFKSQYEFIYESEGGPYKDRSDIGYLRSVVLDHKANEEIGYAMQFTAYPGWVDRSTLSLLTKTLWVCPEQKYLSERLKAKTLLPMSFQER